jgi:hypothetical protein
MVTVTLISHNLIRYCFLILCIPLLPRFFRTEIKHRKDIYLSEETGDQGEKNRAPDKNQADYQTACVAYANWLSLSP